ncbi:MAG: hypothetical protein KJ600_05555 [Nanoarchaeota archaeon]|nr:hypothetical protein [Nanoarchaeota archaeon]MBU1103994.1 hypothetical protein [Nanoarchaeota archaeon]
MPSKTNPQKDLIKLPIAERLRNIQIKSKSSPHQHKLSDVIIAGSWAAFSQSQQAEGISYQLNFEDPM